MAIDPTRVPRFGHGSRVPGWDEAADLTKDPEDDPRPRDDAGPRGAAHGDRGLHGALPRPPLGDDPGAARRAGHVRLVLAAGDRAGGVRDAPDARLPDRGRDLLRHVLHRSRSGRHDVYVCTNISCSLRGADELFAAFHEHGGDDPELQHPRLRVPRRLRHRADGVDRRQLRRARSAPDEVARRARRRSARGEEPLPDRQLERMQVRRPASAAHAVDERAAAVQGHRRARPEHARRLRAPRRLRGAAQGARHDARARSCTSSRPRPSAAAAAPASRWARRSPSCPRARWTSTSSATPTSPSPAPSRTASSCRRTRTC